MPLLLEKEEQMAALQSEISHLNFELRTLLGIEQGKKNTISETLFDSQKAQRSTADDVAVTNVFLNVPQRTQEHSMSALQALNKSLYLALTLAEKANCQGKNSRLLDFSTDALAIEKRRLLNPCNMNHNCRFWFFAKKKKSSFCNCKLPSSSWFFLLETLQKNFFSLLPDGEKPLKEQLATIHPFETKKIDLLIPIKCKRSSSHQSNFRSLPTSTVFKLCFSSFGS